MKFKIFLIFFCFPIAVLHTQSTVKKYVKANSVPIMSISPDSLDYADLSPIQTAIGNARIVMFGEQDHGDAPTFLAKTRLINYLHEKMGFDVLAFESDFFALNEGFDRFLPDIRKNPVLLDSFLKKSVYTIWTYCNACKPLFNSFIPSTYTTKNPLIVTGFDNQITSSYSSKWLIHSLDSALTEKDLPITKRAEYMSLILPLIDSLQYRIYFQKDQRVFSTCDYYLTEIKKEMEGKFDKDNFWIMLISNLIAENQEFKDLYDKQKNYESKNTRDFEMAKNLNWLCNVKFAGKKIIVWAQNFHISKFAGHFKDKVLSKRRSMGTVFAEDFNMEKNTYVLGFTSYQGKAGRLGGKEYTLDPPKSDAFENWLPHAWEYGFVDFSELNNNINFENEMFYMSGSPDTYLHKSYKAFWNKMFDGVFYIKNMYPCTTLVKYSDPK